MQLSKSEEVVMSHIWKLGSAFMKEIIQEFEEPRPAPTTLATLLKRMTDKGFISYELEGKSRKYYPLVAKEDYVSGHLEGVVKDFFDNSASQFASFFTRKTDFTKEELEALKQLIDDEIKKK